MKLKRWFKKRFYLPFKYRCIRKNIIKNHGIRDKREIFKLKWKLEEDLLLAERNNHENGMTIIKAKLEIIKYFTYDSTSNQSYYKDSGSSME